MCGRFVTVIPAEELRKIFDLIENPPVEPRYNLCPTQQAGVIRCCDDTGHNRFDVMKWGLVPSWSKDPKMGSHMINARSETVAEKPAFRHAIKYNRCIVPVAGFYEWNHDGKEKHPHYIYLKDSPVMALAGIWEHWKSPEGSVSETFSILTTAPNKLLSTLHDRMPVILNPNDYGLWLNKNLHDPHHLEHLYQPYPDEMLTYHKVPDLVNNPRFDSPACIIQV